MTVESMQTISLVFYLLAGVMFISAIALFFLLKVPSLFGDITGSTARKAIETIRMQNEYSGDKANKPSPINISRGKITEKISKSGRLQQSVTGYGGSPGTEKFATTQLSAYASVPENAFGAAETTLLDPSMNETSLPDRSMNETSFLDQSMNDTSVPEQSMNETSVISPECTPYGETTVLSESEFRSETEPAGFGRDEDFSLDFEIRFTASSDMVI